MFTIRQANSSDSLAIAKVQLVSWSAAYGDLLPSAYIKEQDSLAAKVEMWQKVIAHPEASTWVAQDKNDEDCEHVVGFISCFNKDSEWEITTLYILPDYQGQGIGSQLMNSALDHILAANSRAKLYLWVLATNVKAISFYQQHGFVASAHSSEEWYEGSKIVDIKMVRSMPDSES